MSETLIHSPMPTDERESAANSLPGGVRLAMEKRFRTSFADVRIHSDGQAAARSEALGARAFTEGRDIHFAAGCFNPRTASGLALLAHELTHVVQQRNGRFGGEGGRTARSRLELEREAERVQSEVQHGSASLAVRGIAAPRTLLRSPGLLEELRARARGNITAMAEAIAARSENPLIQSLNALRIQLRPRRELALGTDVAARFEALYRSFCTLAPGWVPVPVLRFSGPPVQCAAFVIAIPIAVILLFLAFLIVMIWLLGNLDPATRRARERAAQEVIDSLREALRPRPRPAPPEAEPAPQPQAEPQPRPQAEPRAQPRAEPEPRVEPRTEPRVEPRAGPEPRPAPEARPGRRLGPDLIPNPEPRRRREPGAYPLIWPSIFGPPMLFDRPITFFVKTAQQERDETYSWELRRELWARHRHSDPDLLPRDYHAHHIVPLFLGGIEGARGNITFLPGRLHLMGHGRLASQPQMRTPPPPLAPLPANLLRHPSGTRYFLAGFK
ncbi:eCIS core domain-containing protein [Niveibacterium terrae]|uniref:eCIS core domain-containing protein n=1 Tax=Niveibacterium terrae TaxID=3373598 RepID=UPI003A8FF686